MDDKAAFDRMFNEWYAQFVYFAYYFVNDVKSSFIIHLFSYSFIIFWQTNIH